MVLIHNVVVNVHQQTNCFTSLQGGLHLQHFHTSGTKACVSPLEYRFYNRDNSRTPPFDFDLRVMHQHLPTGVAVPAKSNSALAAFWYRISVAHYMLHMPREKLLRVRLSDEEYQWLQTYAKSTSRQISEVIRDYIKRLPRGKPDGD